MTAGQSYAGRNNYDPPANIQRIDLHARPLNLEYDSTRISPTCALIITRVSIHTPHVHNQTVLASQRRSHNEGSDVIRGGKTTTPSPPRCNIFPHH